MLVITKIVYQYCKLKLTRNCSMQLIFLIATLCYKNIDISVEDDISALDNNKNIKKYVMS